MIAEISDMQADINERWTILWVSLFASMLSLSFAWLQGFFISLDKGSSPLRFSGEDVLRGFSAFICAEVLLIPLILGGIYNLLGLDFKQELTSNSYFRSWTQLIILSSGFIAVGIAYSFLTPLQKKCLWNLSEKPWYRQVGIGIATCLIIFPVVLAFIQGVSLSIWYLFQHPFVEQFAVKNVRSALENPFLFLLTAFGISVLVPITEEYLFRGLFQTWLKEKLDRPYLAIALSSFLFAFFHFSSDYGLTNIEFLSSLFLLSCMLGYLYERQRSLWAPIGLHGFFNLISIGLIYFE